MAGFILLIAMDNKSLYPTNGNYNAVKTFNFFMLFILANDINLDNSQSVCHTVSYKQRIS
jgi:hypothetical protein